jgi:hypothetical protein
MIKLRNIWSIGISLLIISLAIGSDNAYAAGDHIITITNSNVGHNQTTIFEEPNIGPGFSGSYNVRINNQSSYNIGINLQSIEEDSINTLTLNDLGMALSRNGQIIASNQIGSSDLTNHNTICLGANSSELLMLHVWLDSSLGNEYQGRSFYADITFSADSSKCENDTNDEQNPNLPELPNTGESRFILYLLYSLIAAFSVLTVWFLIILITKRKREDEEKSRKNSK